ncbi:MAG: cysteine synthase family protein, partial [Candidatus Dadabacteria bacterium]|nr:cysteine synthase family protein [Candidatus Dadabacteria bacterium]
SKGSLGGILDQIGKTPLIELSNISSGRIPSLYAKLEFFNPSGSIKDRVARYILENSEKNGKLEPGELIVESTSGNMGLSFALISAIKGYRCLFAIPETVSEEKIKTLRLFGAEVVLTPRGLPPSDKRSCYKVAQRIAEEKGALYVNQYFNKLNPESHYHSIAPEIWKQTNGKVDAVFCGIGTGGTISGVGKYLKELKPSTKIIGVEPVGSVFREYYREGIVPQAGNFEVEGIGKNFIPGTLDLDFIDDVVQVSDKRSYQTVTQLISKEGVFAGGSGGAVVAAAIDYCGWLEKDRCVVVIIPDTGLKYISKLTV